VVARVKADIVIPKPDRPSEGPIVFRVDTGIKDDSRKLSTEIGKLFEKIIKESNALDPSSLCITTGKYVWALTCETTLISDEGNIIDAMSFALVLALLDFRKPGVTVEKGQVQLKTNLQALSVHHIPVSFTFGLMENGVFLDPYLQEEEAYEGRITITINVYKDVCSIHKPGGMPIEHSTLIKLVEVCELKVKEFTSLIRNFVERRQHYVIS
jgi:exosome complex component RRP45